MNIHEFYNYFNYYIKNDLNTDNFKIKYNILKDKSKNVNVDNYIDYKIMSNFEIYNLDNNYSIDLGLNFNQNIKIKKMYDKFDKIYHEYYQK